LYSCPFCCVGAGQPAPAVASSSTTPNRIVFGTIPLSSGGVGILALDVVKALWSPEVCAAAGLVVKKQDVVTYWRGLKRRDERITTDKDKALFLQRGYDTYITSRAGLTIILNKLQNGECYGRGLLPYLPPFFLKVYFFPFMQRPRLKNSGTCTAPRSLAFLGSLSHCPSTQPQPCYRG
jgi:hypothetical protein